LLSAEVTPPTACLTTVGGQTVQSPGLYTGTADQVNTPLTPDQTSQLQVSQERLVLSGGSGLLSPPNPNPGLGFLNPIPNETTQARVETDRSTGSIVFDLSGPTSGRPGETLVAWILTLPAQETFARDRRFHIVSQSRRDLVPDVNYYPGGDNNPL